MPKSLQTSLVTDSKAKKSHGSKKCKQPCQSSSSSSCCSTQCLDCCTSQYQRLSNFTNLVVVLQMYDDWNIDISGQQTRCGANILPPTTQGAYANQGCTGESDAAEDLTNLNLAQTAYYYVNQYAYGPYEPGCHNDQVYGWFVDISTGQLQLFAEYNGVPTNATRLCLSNDTALNMTSVQKRQLKVLNRLYRLSKSAIKEVNGIPSLEGNIVEVCDCKGERWLLYVNTAEVTSGSPLGECNYQFAVVATKLC
jgi:hypothetical protein